MNERIVMRLNSNGTKDNIQMRELLEGDKFELFEPDGEPVVAGKTWEAVSDAYFKDGIWGVDCQP